MNCQPNDLAVVVGIPQSARPEFNEVGGKLLGRIVRVTALDPWFNQPVWLIEEPFVVTYTGGSVKVEGIGDSVLQPLRNEPDTDEVTTDRTIDEGVAA